MTKMDADRIISLPLEQDLAGNLCQNTRPDLFQTLENNFLISIILGMTFWLLRVDQNNICYRQR